VSLFVISRVMGTSVAQIDATYGHLVPDTDEYVRTLMDAGDARRMAAERTLTGRSRRTRVAGNPL